LGLFVASACLGSEIIRAHPRDPWLNPCMDCRPNCGACCIAPSITSPIPGMPHGKPAGIPCVQLLPDMRCAIFGQPERPAFCVSLRPDESMCHSTRDEALDYLTGLELQTRPLGMPIGRRLGEG
jgi:hypothetical protein